MVIYHQAVLTMVSPITRGSIPRPGCIIKYDIIYNIYVEVESFEAYNAYKRMQQLRRQEEKDFAHKVKMWRAERQQQWSGDLPKYCADALVMKIMRFHHERRRARWVAPHTSVHQPGRLTKW